MRVFSDMQLFTSLVVDKPSGEQIVRGPRCTDAVGTSLREAFGDATGIPDDMVMLLGKLDHTPRRFR